MIQKLLISVLGFVASYVAAASLDLEGVGGDGAFTFTFDVAENSTVSSTKYYVPSIDKSSPVVVHETVTWTRGSPPEQDTPIAFTVLFSNDTTITGDLLSNLLSEYLDDDIYTGDFLEGVYLSVPNAKTLERTAVEFLISKSVSYLAIPPSITAPLPCNDSPINVMVTPSSCSIPPGPYFAALGGCGASPFSLRKAYALFPDLQEAFMNGFTANDDGSYSYVNVWDPAQYGLMVPVPSKLYSKLLDTSRYPLAGYRFAVKDLMPVQGIVTGGGSRAMLRVYNSPAAATAPAIQQLIDLGATLVGKTKLTVFAFGAWPYQTDDFAYSWNIRADGYLGLSASSYGSAAAIAAYDYLDMTIGSDTGGSVRNPADRVGVYGIRPTWSVINTSLVIPSATSLDTLGFLARSPELIEKIAKIWDTDHNPHLLPGTFSLPTKIFFPTEFFPVDNSIAQDMIDAWLSKVTTTFNMTLEPQNVTELFLDKVTENDTLASYTSDIFSMSTYDSYNLFGKKLLDDYERKFGQYPELDVAAFSSWQTAPEYTAETRAANEQRRQDFEDFINTYVIPYSEETCTEGFWVYHISDKGGGVPEYRDVLTYDYFPPFNPMRAASIAPFAKLVDITIPIGAITYDSVISKKEEPLVITVNLVAHKGCDFVLLDFIKACSEAGLCQEVKTGRYAF